MREYRYRIKENKDGSFEFCGDRYIEVQSCKPCLECELSNFDICNKDYRLMQECEECISCHSCFKREV